MNAGKALELGVIDEILNGDLLATVLEFANRVVDENRPLRVISRMTATLKAASGPDYFNGCARAWRKRLGVTWHPS